MRVTWARFLPCVAMAFLATLVVFLVLVTVYAFGAELFGYSDAWLHALPTFVVMGPLVVISVVWGYFLARRKQRFGHSLGPRSRGRISRMASERPRSATDARIKF